MTWQHNADKKFRSKDGVSPLGPSAVGDGPALYWAYQQPLKARMGSESPLRRLDGTDVDIRSGDRVFIDGAERFGLATACGPVTLDNESIWLVSFDPESEWGEPTTACFPYHTLRRSHDV